MEGAENVSRSLRQVDDAGNKMIGGVAAGGMLGILCKRRASCMQGKAGSRAGFRGRDNNQ